MASAEEIRLANQIYATTKNKTETANLLSKRLGRRIPRTTVKDWLKEDISETTPEASNKNQLDNTLAALATLSHENQVLKAELARYSRQSLTREAIRQEVFKLASQPVKQPEWLTQIGKRTGSPSNSGVPTLFCSDWHWGEVVNPNEINGFNKYDLSIAHKRVENLVTRTISLLFDKLASPQYDGLVLVFGGDMVSGDIHEELSKTNERPIMPIVHDLDEVLVDMIEALLVRFDRIHIPCVTGNHGRTTRKMQSKERAATNFEWIIYHRLHQWFTQDRYEGRITFQIPDGADCYYRIYDHRYLLTHGDQFRGGDGLIGPLGPICVAPETPILLSDLTYKPARDVRVGDELVGFDENVEDGKRRRFLNSIVTECRDLTLDCLEIETDDGLKTIASMEHAWLVRSGACHAWRQTQNLKIGDSILSLGPPWSKCDTWESGYLAGVLDGEGSIGKSKIQFTQQKNACLAGVTQILDKLEISYHLYENGAEKRGYEPCFAVRLFEGSVERKLGWHAMRLLGTIQPPRLMTEYSKRLWDGLSVQLAKESNVTGLRYIGKQPVAGFTTSTNTFIANGLLSHNTRGRHKKHTRDSSLGQGFDTMLNGHFHTLMQLPHLVVNGALIGYSEYPYVGNFEAERPAQALWLTHKTEGITLQMPVYVDDHKKKAETSWISIQKP